MELGHLLTRSGFTYPEVSSKVYHGSFCQLGISVSLSWVIYFEAFYLHVVKAKGSNPTAGLSLLWARSPFRGNLNRRQVSPNIIRVIKSKECDGQGVLHVSGTGEVHTGFWLANMTERGHLED